MNVFSFRNRIIEDYRDYVSSFISIAQPRLDEFVKGCFKSGSLWPDPLISPAATADYIYAYREMWDSEEKEEQPGERKQSLASARAAISRPKTRRNTSQYSS